MSNLLDPGFLSSTFVIAGGSCCTLACIAYWCAVFNPESPGSYSMRKRCVDYLYPVAEDTVEIDSSQSSMEYGEYGEYEEEEHSDEYSPPCHKEVVRTHD